MTSPRWATPGTSWKKWPKKRIWRSVVGGPYPGKGDGYKQVVNSSTVTS